MAEINRDYVIDRQGKPFVTYVGLLDAAHKQGLREISTEILQFPSAGNDDTCIVRATVQLERRSDGSEGACLFTGIGDANPKNVSRNIAPHAIRMAETRAKARALRDALNVTAELDDDAQADEPAHQAPARPATNGHAPAPRRADPGPPQEAPPQEAGPPAAAYEAQHVVGEDGEILGTTLVGKGDWPKPGPQQEVPPTRPTAQQVTLSIEEKRRQRAAAIENAIAQAKGDATPPELTTEQQCQVYAGLLLDGMRLHGLTQPKVPPKMPLAAWLAVIRSLEQKFTRQPASPAAGGR